MTSLFLTSQSGSRELPKRILQLLGTGHTGARGKEDKRHDEDGLPLLGGESGAPPSHSREPCTACTPKASLGTGPPNSRAADHPVNGEGARPLSEPSPNKDTREPQQRAKHSHQHRALYYLPQPNQLAALLGEPQPPRMPLFQGEPPKPGISTQGRAWRAPRQGGDTLALCSTARTPRGTKNRGDPVTQS